MSVTHSYSFIQFAFYSLGYKLLTHNPACVCLRDSGLRWELGTLQIVEHQLSIGFTTDWNDGCILVW